MMETIFLTEGETHVRKALHLILERQSGLQILGEAGTSESTLAEVSQNPLDIILLDWSLPRLHPQRLVTALRSAAQKW